MALQRAMRVAHHGLNVQRSRMELISNNIANAQTTRTPEGGPYRRQLPVVAATPEGRQGSDPFARLVRAARVVRVEADPRPPIMRFMPEHPHADEQGYVAFPNVEPAEEMVDMVSAVRSYEANVNVIKSLRKMSESALSITK